MVVPKTFLGKSSRDTARAEQLFFRMSGNIRQQYGYLCNLELAKTLLEFYVAIQPVFLS